MEEHWKRNENHPEMKIVLKYQYIGSNVCWYLSTMELVFSSKRKISLIETLVYRAIKICSTSNLPQELNMIRKIFKDSGYPSNVIEKTIKNKLMRSSNDVQYGPKKDPVYMKLPYKGIASERASKSIRSIVQSTYGSVSLRMIFSTNQMLPTSHKDALPKDKKSNVIYKFTCNRCESEYIRKTERRLSDRIKEHIPTALRCNSQRPKMPSTYNLRSQPREVCTASSQKTTQTSAIRLHLIDNPDCASQYTKDSFQIIGSARSAFQLSILEAVLINSNKPILCRHREFVYHCKLFRNYISK